MRHRDIHILTVGAYTYTSDQRFMAIHHRDNDEWTLQIKWAQKRDAGIYECQISTQPVRSFFVNLNVVGEFECSRSTCCTFREMYCLICCQHNFHTCIKNTNNIYWQIKRRVVRNNRFILNVKRAHLITRGVPFLSKTQFNAGVYLLHSITRVGNRRDTASLYTEM